MAPSNLKAIQVFWVGFVSFDTINASLHKVASFYKRLCPQHGSACQLGSTSNSSVICKVFVPVVRSSDITPSIKAAQDMASFTDVLVLRRDRFTFHVMTQKVNKERIKY